mgnify:CR=1 FL=1
MKKYAVTLNYNCTYGFVTYDEETKTEDSAYLLFDVSDKTLDKTQTLLLTLGQLVADVAIIGRFELRECQILQLALDVVESEFVSNLCVEIHRLPRLLFAPSTATAPAVFATPAATEPATEPTEAATGATESAA